MIFERDINQVKMLLISMGLNEYQASALSHLILIGETKATTLSKSSGVPSARIYEVLNELAKMGLVTVKPGRPTMYAPRHPEDISSSLISISMNQLKQKLKVLEDYAKDFTELTKKIYLKGKKGTTAVPLLRIVSVGGASIDETRKLFDSAKEEILILSRAMEYFPEVSENLKRALATGVSLRIILMNPELLESDAKEKQASIIEKIKENLGPKVEIRFAEDVPIRGSIIDPSKDGKVLFLVEDPGVPLFMREAAVSSHAGIVRGLASMFNLLWEHEAKKPQL